MSTRTAQKPPVSVKSAAPNRLPLIIGGAAAVVLIVIALVIAARGNQTPFVPLVTGAPHAAVSTTLIDHGDLQMEDYAESVFRIQNTGDQPLLILDEPRVELIQGCCPPRALVSRSTLQPGEEATISLRFTMHEMMGGQHEFRVHVVTNDPDQPVIPLTILSNWLE
ncbi:MAG: DUF1573 domain-containing protein [Chloroflexi bacterium]|nr:DUF1573 domain-containing protein [Chloroflexota bacterium]